MDLLKFECNNLIIEGPFFMKKSKNSKVKRGVTKNQTPFFFKEPIFSFYSNGEITFKTNSKNLR